MAEAQRIDQVRIGLAEVRARIESACARAGRDPASVVLVVVTKTHPADDVRILADLGVADVAENREPEGSRKHAECADLRLNWHFVGQLQRNKAGRVARYADFVHSVDRPQIVTALDRAAQSAGRIQRCFVQVDLSGGAEGRGGAAVDQVLPLCAAVADSDALRLVGLMAVAPLAVDPATAFESLANLRVGVMGEFPSAVLLSAGMSGDLEQAVAAGATHLRVGSAVLGVRDNVR